MKREKSLYSIEVLLQEHELSRGVAQRVSRELSQAGGAWMRPLVGMMFH